MHADAITGNDKFEKIHFVFWPMYIGVILLAKAAEVLPEIEEEDQ